MRLDLALLTARLVALRWVAL